MRKEFELAIERAKRQGRNEGTIQAMKRLFSIMQENEENRQYWHNAYRK